MTTTTQQHTASDLFAQALRYENRADPYPYFAQLCRRPVVPEENGTWLVSGYHEISRLLRDPRVSADRRRPEEEQPIRKSLLVEDAPRHDQLRHQVTEQFVPRIMGLRDHIDGLVTGLLDAHTSQRPGQLDVVGDLAYPLPVTLICELLGVPREDEPVFGSIARRLTRGLDPVETQTEDELRELREARGELVQYLEGLIADRQAAPADDLLSGLMFGQGSDAPMDPIDLRVTLALLLIAGHETTVNLIANGTLALLRHPDLLARLRAEPDLVTPLVEEVLRYDPPVQMSGRSTLADIDLGGTTIPKGSRVRLLLAAGNRDPRRFSDPDRFLPDRPGNAHLGFGGGIHYCIGATLARTEAQVALTALARRLASPRLVAAPPPYRENAILRGPDRLLVSFDRLTPDPRSV
ncbi:cytochrome P450 [Streptomyces sioyaensis]|uniref:Cytochrome P450 n=1 Tax=Streptomyces sioyaensis TaxID=67364 RepID=A0A4Q1QQJ5_9ACTN|nr:cytochrome P450 [Streptomyces sioyaensis]MBM4796406.1 cytochrome P450 [Streptomyces sioyaensis]RXS64255.1 cytochrome P450 [Streptomyces sioyaensis]